MINFRYHVISLIAVFLALAIGVIMGSAVIDRAIVDRLEDQQQGLREDIREVEETNDALRAQNRELQETAEQLTEEGSQRLLTGTLGDVPVLVVATRGVEDEGFEALLSLLATSGADRRGTLWLTDRWALDDDDEQRDLADAVGAPSTMEPDTLRRLALTRLATALREATADGADDVVDPAADPTGATGAPEEASLVVVLRDAGYLDFDAPEGEPAESGPSLPVGTRIVLVSGQRADVVPDTLAVPLAGLLVDDRGELPPVALLAAEARPTVEEPSEEFVTLLRGDDDIADRLSTVDNIGDFPGRLAAVLALVDLGEDRVGHFGRGPGAQRLLPAPPETEG
jgi:hypothetical protein